MKDTLLSFLGFVLIGLGLLSYPVTAQTTYTITGRVTDATNREGIPFATVALKGKPIGTVTDAEGRYSLHTTQISDSLLVTTVGYQTGAYRLLPVATQTIDAALNPAATRLQEVKVYAKGGDPAYRILREAIKRRDQFDPSQLTAFQYESYSKVEAYVNNFDHKRKNGKGPGPVGRLLSRLPAVTDDNGNPAVPVYVSETFSEYYQRSNPDKTKERILKSHASGVGVTNGGLAAQLTGASFQQYNFYQNYVSLLRKDLPSPLGQAWQTIYNFHLIDTVGVGDVTCFQIDFEPKRAAELAFAGTVWIDTTRFGLVQMDARIDKRANINFVDEIRIQQEWEDIDNGVRLPVRNQLLIDTQEPTPNAPGALVRFYMANRNVKANQPQEIKFYEPAVELADNYKERSPAYWQQIRPEGLAPEELRAIEVVDSVRNTPFMRFVSNVVDFTLVGYYRLGNSHLEIGPLLNSYAYNTVEGHRLRVGFRTNTGFSRRWVIGGYGAYGTLDGRFKYGMNVDYIVAKKPWTIVGIQHSYDLERLGVSSENLGSNALFGAYTRFGTFRRPYFQENTYAYIKRELGRGFTQTIGMRNRTFDPLFAFAYRMPGSTTTTPEDAISTDYRTTDLVFETRFAPGELVLQNDNERFSVGASNKPVLTFRYDLGLKNVFSGDFTYHRFALNYQHSFRLGVLGRTRYAVNLAYIPSTIPYPLLNIPLGNQSFFYVDNAYNLMNYFEFVTDRQAALRWEHNFEGLFFNGIPAIRRLKWRFLTTAKVLYGSVSKANSALIPSTDDQGRPVLGFQSLNRTPYVEVGYGIDNILKVFRVDAVHRLTYRNNPGIATFGIRVSAWVGL